MCWPLALATLILCELGGRHRAGPNPNTGRRTYSEWSERLWRADSWRAFFERFAGDPSRVNGITAIADAPWQPRSPESGGWATSPLHISRKRPAAPRPGPGGNTRRRHTPGPDRPSAAAAYPTTVAGLPEGRRRAARRGLQRTARGLGRPTRASKPRRLPFRTPADRLRSAPPTLIADVPPLPRGMRT